MNLFDVLLLIAQRTGVSAYASTPIHLQVLLVLRLNEEQVHDSLKTRVNINS